MAEVRHSGTPDRRAGGNSLPEEWVKSHYGAFLDLQNGYAFKSSTYVEHGAFVIRIGNVQEGVVSLHNPAYVDLESHKNSPFKLDPDDVLVSLTGNVGRIAIIKQEQLPAVLNQRVARVIWSSGINWKYAFYSLQSKYTFDEIMKTAKGAAQLNVSTKDILNIQVPLPPLAEQKVIAEKLDTLLAQVDTTKARLERIPDIIKRFRQSVLAAAVSGKLTEEWRHDRKPISPCFNTISERKESLIKSKTVKKDLTAEQVSRPKNYVNDWLYLKLKSLASKITDGEHKTPKRESNGRYLLSARNVQDGYITVSNVDYVGEDEYQKLRKRCDPNKGDLLISCSGSVGRICLVDKDDMYVMVRSAALVRIVKDFINEKYLMYFLQSPASQKAIEDSSKSTAQSNLFLGPIKELDIALPSIEEQTEIVRRIEELFAFADTIEQKAAAALERVNNLTQSILAKAFRGELTADWRAANPELISGDNSSEALLAKIQAEREALKPVKKGRKKKAEP